MAEEVLTLVLPWAIRQFDSLRQLHRTALGHNQSSDGWVHNSSEIPTACVNV
jgi:hypothetical protein